MEWHDTLVPEMRAVIRALLDPLSALLLSLTCKAEREQWRGAGRRPLDEKVIHLLGGFASPEFYERWKPAGPLCVGIAEWAAREGNVALLNHMPLPVDHTLHQHLAMLGKLYDQREVRRLFPTHADLYGLAMRQTCDARRFPVSDFIRAFQTLGQAHERWAKKLENIRQQVDVLEAGPERKALNAKRSRLECKIKCRVKVLDIDTLLQSRNVAVLAFVLQHESSLLHYPSMAFKIAQVAIESGQCSVLQWAFDVPPPLGGSDGVLMQYAGDWSFRYRVLRKGQLEVCQWLYQHLPWDADEVHWATEVARQAGHAPLAQWLASYLK